MKIMLNHKKPDDYVVATGKTHTIREFIEEAFRVVGKEIHWQGRGMKEVGRVGGARGKVVVKVDAKFFRPAEVDFLLGDASKAHKELGWKPKVSFKQVVQRMVQHDLAATQRPMAR